MSHDKTDDMGKEAVISHEETQQKGLAQPLDQSVAQGEAELTEAERVEAALADERKQEANEHQEEHRERMQTLRKLTQAVKNAAEISQPRKQGMDTLHSELKTLRAAVLLAHSVEPKAENKRLQPLNSVQTPLDPFALDSVVLNPFQLSAATQVQQVPAKEVPEAGEAAQAPRKRTLSPEARARISAAQKIIWAKRRGDRRHGEKSKN